MDPSLPYILLGAIIVAILSFLAVKVGAIDFAGSFSGALISFVAFLAGGFPWLVMIITFFVVSSILTRFHYDYKRRIGSAQEKGGRRSWRNTVANGGMAGFVSILAIFYHQELLAVAFLGSLSTALSDTVATEVGLLSDSKPRLITSLGSIVEPGVSGGVSGLGELVAFGSSIGLGLVGILLRMDISQASRMIVAVAVGGILGTNIDSLLGATLQRIRRCAICGSLTENKRHHGVEAVVVKGYSFMDNNIVNFLATLLGTLIAVLVYVIV